MSVRFYNCRILTMKDSNIIEGELWTDNDLQLVILIRNLTVRSTVKVICLCQVLRMLIHILQ